MTHFKHKKRPLFYEILQRRDLMAADISFDTDSGLVDIGGTEYRDVVRLRDVLDANGVDVTRITATSYEPGGPVTVVQDIPENSVRKVVFRGHNGDDDFDASGVFHEIEAHGDDGNDTLRGGYGGAGNKLYGNQGRDTLVGGRRNDELWGGRGDDRLYGGRGNDRLYGGFYDPSTASMIMVIRDLLDLDPDNDRLYGQENDDILYGGTGNDALYGGLGNDALWGGYGNDVIRGDRGTPSAAGCADQLYGQHGNDYLSGEGGIDVLRGDDNNSQRGNDVLLGGDGGDHLFGYAGRDTLLGGKGTDNLYGGDNQDYLDGGYDWARDRLFGGSGDDTFIQHKHETRTRTWWGGYTRVWWYEDDLRDVERNDRVTTRVNS